MRNFGPCMCGDTHCHSCGPAQGNGYCPYCGAWEDDGGCSDPKKCELAAQEDAEGQERQYLEDQLLEAEAARQGVPVCHMDDDGRYQEIIKMTVEQLRKEVRFSYFF